MATGRNDALCVGRCCYACLEPFSVLAGAPFWECASFPSLAGVSRGPPIQGVPLILYARFATAAATEGDSEARDGQLLALNFLPPEDYLKMPRHQGITAALPFWHCTTALAILRSSRRSM